MSGANFDWEPDWRPPGTRTWSDRLEAHCGTWDAAEIAERVPGLTVERARSIESRALNLLGEAVRVVGVAVVS
jgi:hypothetical protein